MTLREKIYIGLAATVGVILLIIFRDSRSQAIIDGFFRRKMVDDLASKIEQAITSVDSAIKIDKERLVAEAEKYRNTQADESPAAIAAYYTDLLKRRGK